MMTGNGDHYYAGFVTRSGLPLRSEHVFQDGDDIASICVHIPDTMLVMVLLLHCYTC